MNIEAIDKTEALQGEINGLKQLLVQTDYMAIKFAEGEISEADYSEAKKQRQAWRDRINDLEAQIAAVE